MDFRQILFEKAGDGEGGGGGGDPEKNEGTFKIEDLVAQNKALMERLEKLESTRRIEKEDDDLSQKVKKKTEEDDKRASESKSLEEALKFQIGAKDWIQKNSSLLPKGIDEIFSMAEKETYSSAIEKDGAIKSAIIQKFFEVQTNLDLLTSGLKTKLDEWQKLTKNVREQRAQEIYTSVFEPTFETLRAVKKAEQRSKGHGENTDSEKAYKEKLMKLSRQKYMGEKSQ